MPNRERNDKVQHQPSGDLMRKHPCGTQHASKRGGKSTPWENQGTHNTNQGTILGQIIKPTKTIQIKGQLFTINKKSIVDSFQSDFS